MSLRIDFKNLNIVNFNGSPIHVIRINGQDAWTDGVIVRFIVGDTVFATQMVPKGGHVQEITEQPVVEGYTFMGWSLNGLSKFDFENYVVNGALDIYAALSQDLYESKKSSGSIMQLGPDERLSLDSSGGYSLYLLNDKLAEATLVSTGLAFTQWGIARVNDKIGIMNTANGVAYYDRDTNSVHECGTTKNLQRLCELGETKVLLYSYSTLPGGLYAFDIPTKTLTAINLEYIDKYTYLKEDDSYIYLTGTSKTASTSTKYLTIFRVSKIDLSFSVYYTDPDDQLGSFYSFVATKKGEILFFDSYDSVELLDFDTLTKTKIFDGDDSIIWGDCNHCLPNGDVIISDPAQSYNTSRNSGVLLYRFDTKTVTAYGSGCGYEGFTDLPSGDCLITFQTSSSSYGNPKSIMRYNCAERNITTIASSTERSMKIYDHNPLYFIGAGSKYAYLYNDETKTIKNLCSISYPLAKPKFTEDGRAFICTEYGYTSDIVDIATGTSLYRYSGYSVNGCGTIGPNTYVVTEAWGLYLLTVSPNSKTTIFKTDSSFSSILGTSRDSKIVYVGAATLADGTSMSGIIIYDFSDINNPTYQKLGTFNMSGFATNYASLTPISEHELLLSGRDLLGCILINTQTNSFKYIIDFRKGWDVIETSGNDILISSSTRKDKIKARYTPSTGALQKVE